MTSKSQPVTFFYPPVFGLFTAFAAVPPDSLPPRLYKPETPRDMAHMLEREPASFIGLFFPGTNPVIQQKKNAQ